MGNRDKSSRTKTCSSSTLDANGVCPKDSLIKLKRIARQVTISTMAVFLRLKMLGLCDELASGMDRTAKSNSLQNLGRHDCEILCGEPQDSTCSRSAGISSHHAAAPAVGVVRTTRDQAATVAVWEESDS